MAKNCKHVVVRGVLWNRLVMSPLLVTLSNGYSENYGDSGALNLVKKVSRADNGLIRFFLGRIERMSCARIEKSKASIVSGCLKISID